MFNKITLLSLGFLLTAGLSVKAQQTGFQHQNGDLLFQDLDCGDLCDAIESVTMGYNNASFSHVGIVQLAKNGSVQVLEAIGDSVHMTPLDKFLNRQLDAENKPKVVVGRLKEPFQKFIPEALKAGHHLRGKPYDNAFNMANDAYYCSELIYEIFRVATKDYDFFRLYPMTYNHPNTGKTMQVWVEYFQKLKIKVPEKEPGLNPGSISRSNKLKIYQPYGKPGIRKAPKA